MWSEDRRLIEGVDRDGEWGGEDEEEEGGG